VTFPTQAEVLRFFDGLELVEPGLIPVLQWRPISDLEAASPTVMWGGIVLTALPPRPATSRGSI
jgi:S-adenosyl methyltransferase